VAEAFTSNLTVDEHHAIRSVGFSPVGQVMGTCVYRTVTRGMWSCGLDPEYPGRPGMRRSRSTRLGGWQWLTPAVREVRPMCDALNEARVATLRKMRAECAGLGGDGVVALTLTIEPFPAGGLEFKAVGTAVRATGPVRPRRPFLSDLSGQEFAKLMSAGWIPCGLVMGLTVAIRHDDWGSRRQGRSWTNTEITSRTNLVQGARHFARSRLRNQAAKIGGEGVVVRESSLRVWEQSCAVAGGEDHLAEAMVIGTAMTQFHFRYGTDSPSPMIMRLR
jgi:uncharacterized protein YbjQ (UPF0145 family)